MTNRKFSIQLAIAIVLPVLGQAGAFLALLLWNASGQPFALLVINAAFLLACILCMRLFRMTPEDIGLKLLPALLRRHAALCLGILLVYLLYYILGVRISALRPLTSATAWALLGYLVVAFAEEIYFRGLLYRIFLNRLSGPAAVLWTALIFAFFHIRQGPAALLRLPTGLLWGSVRYSSGMVFLLAFPVHFVYNAAWLLFQGHWEDPPGWAYLIPVVELALGLLILRLRPPNPQTPSSDHSPLLH